MQPPCYSDYTMIGGTSEPARVTEPVLEDEIRPLGRNPSFRTKSVLQYPHNGEFVEQINSVRCLAQAGGQVCTGGVKRLVSSRLPQEACGHIIHHATIGDEGRGAVSPVVMLELSSRESAREVDSQVRGSGAPPARLGAT